ncbi:MAG: 2-hydroxycarboxylate transporter family protein [Clostridium butyricum]|nr:2-hydroxycarboxylate transporter family protein [Clostridium butyricum]
MAYKEEITKGKSFWSIKISGVSLSIFLVMVAVLIAAIALGKLPSSIMGPIAVLVIIGNLFYYIGNRLPIIKDYLGGGSVFTIFAAAALATFGILPASVIESIHKFVSNMGFLDFYIAALIAGSILAMDRDLLIKASVRYIPVALISMIVSLFAVAIVGKLIGYGFIESILYIAFPAMAGGVGAGAVPLSSIYASALGVDASQVISRLIPTTAMTNVLAIIGAALLARLGKSLPNANGEGKLMKDGDFVPTNTDAIKPDITQMGVGLMLAITFFLLGQIGNYFIPKVHAYAFIIIFVMICKIGRILPKSYEDAACMYNNLIVKNLTSAVLAGIGIALLNLNVLVEAFNWQFVVLCLVSVITIGIISAFVGKLFGLYPIESAITAGMCDNSMGGTGNVAVLSASNRMELMAFAQMGNRLGGAIILIVSGFVVQLIS